MSHRTDHPKKCSECPTMLPGSAWDTIRAQDAGWFFQKDGTIYCPEHVPGWVEAWRAKQKSK